MTIAQIALGLLSMTTKSITEEHTIMAGGVGVHCSFRLL